MSATDSRQFVDTNILVYASDSSAGWKFQHAAMLVDDLWERDAGCLSIQVLQELYVNLTQKIPLRYPLPESIELISEYAEWRIHSPVPGDVLRAIGIQSRYQISFWDAMIVNSAAALNCGTLWTEDLNHGQDYDEVRVVNPFLDQDS